MGLSGVSGATGMRSREPERGGIPNLGEAGFHSGTKEEGLGYAYAYGAPRPLGRMHLAPLPCVPRVRTVRNAISASRSDVRLTSEAESFASS